MAKIKIDINNKDIKNLLKDSFYMDKTAQSIVKKSIDEAVNVVIRNVKLKTPVGIYTNKGLYGKYNIGRVGGTLRASWTHTGTTKINDRVFKNTVFNPIDYAEYVEYGHRQTAGRFVPQIGKRLKAFFVNGKYILTNTVNDFENNNTLEKIFTKNIKGAKWFKK